MTGTTYPELAAAQACLRLLHTARAALTAPVTAQTAALLAVPIADADEALRRAGLAGNEAWLLDRIYGLAPQDPTVPGPAGGDGDGPAGGAEGGGAVDGTGGVAADGTGDVDRRPADTPSPDGHRPPGAVAEPGAVPAAPAPRRERSLR